MNCAKFVLLLAAAVLPLAGQAKDKETPDNWVRRVFQLKYADPRSVNNLLQVFGYPVRVDTEMRTLAVAAPPQGIQAVEDAIKRIDVPEAAAHDVDLTVYLLSASEQGAGAEGIPADLQPVINQLKGIFAYKGFRVLDTMLLRGTVGNQLSTGGIVALGSAPQQKTSYRFSVRPSAISAEPQGRMIGLSELRLFVQRIPIGAEYRDVGISTDLSIREGQKVVVGKSNVNGNEQALILVVTAKVVQ